MLAKRVVLVRRPEIVRGADGFFSVIVEIFAKGRTDLAFQLDCRDQFALVHDKQVPKLN